MLLFREPKVQIVQTLSISKTFYYLMSFMTFFFVYNENVGKQTIYSAKLPLIQSSGNSNKVIHIT